MLQRLARYPGTAPLLVLILVGVTNLVTFPYPRETLERWFAEYGLVENATVVLYALAILWLARLATVDRTHRHLLALSALVLCLPAARELDLHKAFTTTGISKTRFYLDPQIPLAERLTALCVVLAALALLIAYARRYWRPFIDRLRQLQPGAVSVACGIVLVPVSKTFDALPRLLREFGVAHGESLRSFIVINEETMELAIPLMFLVALAQWRAGLR